LIHKQSKIHFGVVIEDIEKNNDTKSIFNIHKYHENFKCDEINQRGIYDKELEWLKK